MEWLIRSRGKSAHASRLWNGINAVDELFHFVETVKANVPEEPCGDAAHAHCTVSLGQIQGGFVANQVPDYAEARLDVRLMPDMSLDVAREWMAAASLKHPTVEAEMLRSTVGMHSPVGPAAKLFINTAKQQTGRIVEPKMGHGASDGRYFAEHGVAVITVQPSGGGQHSEHEWIDIKDLENYYSVLREFTTEWAGPDSRN
jgi:succinyl-diaminopimelate desuccinylase